MIFLLTTLALGLMALPLLKETATAAGRFRPWGFDGYGVLAGFAITAAVAALTSPRLGIAFVFSVLLHEFLSARAFHLLGHPEARVRLVPLPRITPSRTDQPLSQDIEASFAALFAPALSIVPMMIALGMFHGFAELSPGLALLSRDFAVMIGALNFVLLLPFKPFPGGLIINAITRAIWPKFGPLITIFMSAAFFSAAYEDGSIALAILGVAGLQSLLYKKSEQSKPLVPNEALLVMASYSFTLTVHFLGGYWLIKGLI